MKSLLATITSLLFITSASVAGETHSQNHDEHRTEHYSTHGHNEGHAENEHHMTLAGEPGHASHITRTIEVKMLEADDGKMLFEPSVINISKGETIRFSVENNGEFEHEFVLDEHARNMKHKKLMEKFPEMEHDEPNSVRLDPSEKGEVIWKFTNAGTFEFACLIPGHYELGMKGPIEVAGS